MRLCPRLRDALMHMHSGRIRERGVHDTRVQTMQADGTYDMRERGRAGAGRGDSGQ